MTERPISRWVFKHPTNSDKTIWWDGDPELLEGFKWWKTLRVDPETNRILKKAPVISYHGVLIEGKKRLIHQRSGPCTTGCKMAESPPEACQCSCGGKNHGIGRKLPHELTPEEDAELSRMSHQCF